MQKEEIREIIAQMTVEEKASLCSGKDFWHTKGIDRLNIPEMMVSDGPHGLRKQDLKADHLGINDSIKAVCFPTGSALAASFNRDLVKEVGETLGEECQAEDVGIILGPAVNIKRSPLCGRNFEYYSEDPLVASEMAGALIDGVQSKNVGTSIKHFLANNQETRRLTSSSEVDERTLNELYLASFEGAIKNHKPWTVMASYNRLNGKYVVETKEYLTDKLRGDWGFSGFVVSDWGAVNDRVKDLAAGLDLEMPSSAGITDEEIVNAVKDGTLDEKALDDAVLHILSIVTYYMENRDKTAVFDYEKDHEMARKAASETIVLLKNEGVLPLKEDEPIAFIGKYAKEPRYQGGGSSHINSFKKTSALDAVKDNANITFAMGFDDKEDVIDHELVKEAVETAKKAKAAVIFAGLPDAFESEGFDRTNMHMPECQNYLIKEIAKAQKNTIVVLHNGSPVEMPWIHQVKGVVEAYLGGQAIGGAVCDVLFGKVNPSGRLAETFPVKLEDNPSYLYYIGEKDKVEYKEGIFVGYRYYDTKKMEVLFPFGYGLSYTTFDYHDLKISQDQIKDTDSLTVSVDVTNTGDMEGKEVIQLYVGKPESDVIRPVKELRAFTKVNLLSGETKTVSFTLTGRAFSYFNTTIHDWYAEDGTYEIMIGKSVDNIVLTKQVSVSSSKRLPVKINGNTTFQDAIKTEEAREYIKTYLEGNSFFEPMLSTDQAEEEVSAASEAISKEMAEAMMNSMPLRSIRSYSDGKVSAEQLEEIIATLDSMNQ